MTEHLYIHIPFCNHICSYCDFPRVLKEGQDTKKYVQMVVAELKAGSDLKQYKTVFLGGGTPNALDYEDLDFLLAEIQPYLQDTYEWTIETNPDLIDQAQVDLFTKYGINRVSIGVQTTNNDILRKLNRQHTIEDAINAVQLLYKNNIFNVSVDFIYNLKGLALSDIDNSIKLLKDNEIPHVSFYALEIKDGSILNAQGETIDEDNEGEQMTYIINGLETAGYHRYEISNWSINPKTQCEHNKAYWKTHEWRAIGFGASGFENQTLYNIKGDLYNWEVKQETLKKKEYYQQILMMGLRLIEGIDLSVPHQLDAYRMFYDDLINVYVRDNHLCAKHIDLLHECLVEII